MVSKDMEAQLMKCGLTKQQAQNATAEKVLTYFMDKDSQTLINEAKNQVTEMRETVEEARNEYLLIKRELDKVAGILIDIDKAQKEFGIITDEKAKNAISLYSALINISTRAGATGTDAVTNAGYVTYAYLGGQARRNSEYSRTENNKIQLGAYNDE